MEKDLPVDVNFAEEGKLPTSAVRTTDAVMTSILQLMLQNQQQSIYQQLLEMERLLLSSRK